MRLPSSDTSSLLARAGFGLIVTGIPMMLGIKNTYREHRAAGEGRIVAGIQSFSMQALPYLMTFDMPFGRQLAFQLGFAALTYVPAIVGGIASYYAYRSTYLRMASTPFSQSFAPTRWTSEMQQRGMESIMGTRSILGSEASRLAAQYGRRQ